MKAAITIGNAKRSVIVKTTMNKSIIMLAKRDRFNHPSSGRISKVLFMNLSHKRCVSLRKNKRTKIQFKRLPVIDA